LAEKHGGCIYNCQILVDREGERYYYRKAHWPPEETPFWSLGNHYPVHRFGNFVIGTTICYDNNFPEIHRIYGLQGPDLVLAPYAYGKKYKLADPESVKASIYDWKNREKMYLRASAAANYHWIVACVGAGHIKDYVAREKPGEGQEYFFPGCILFIDPEGIVVKESSDDMIVEQLLWYDIDMRRNMEVRMTGHNHFKNRRTATYGRLMELP
jgi:predicted amidohydrolase